MNDELTAAVLAMWASKNLPARLDVEQTAKVLGFTVSDIQVLMSTRKLMPLGDPAPNAPKLFAGVDVMRLAIDLDWLSKATKDVAKYWRHKRQRRGNSPRESIDQGVNPRAISKQRQARDLVF